MRQEQRSGRIATGLPKAGVVLGILALVALAAAIVWPRPGPISAAGTGEFAAAVAAGGDHTCAITTTGGIKCWGLNGDGQLGDNSKTQRNTPVDVCEDAKCWEHLVDVPAVAAGTWHTCALTTASGVKCWGGNNSGQLGDNSKTQRNTPVDVFGLTSGVAAIAAGFWHTCAVITANDTLWCWGENGRGQLGDNSKTQRNTPVEVCEDTACEENLSGVAAVSTKGWHTCALTTAGGVKCWGRNTDGQLGATTTEFCIGFPCSITPVDVSGLTSGVAAVSAGGQHTCALTAAGGVKCWGRNNDGQLGDNSKTQRNTPVDVSGLTTGVAAIAAGGWHTCALTTAGGVKCWGRNDNGQLGNNSKTQRNTPVDVFGLTSGVAAISAGGEHTCAVTTTGVVKCWGNNSSGQVGDATKTQRNTPVDVLGLAGKDITPPNDPTTVGSSSHTVGVPSSDHTITMGWTPAVDKSPGVTGVDGYSFDFNLTPTPTCDKSMNLSATATSVTSVPLSGGSWWFHICTVDRAGFWTNTVVVGPFIIMSPAVGGISVDPELGALPLTEGPLEAGQSSGPSVGVLAGVAAAGTTAVVIALGGAAWYARRREQS